jgi:hypothetical protein
MSQRRTVIPAHWTPVQEAAYLTVHEYGSAELAPLMGKAQRYLDNEVNPDNEQAKLGLDDAVAIQHATRDYRILHAMGQTLGHACVQVADLSGISDVQLLDSILEWDADIGQTKAAIREALDDGDVSDEEYRRIEREVFEDFARELAVLQRLRSLREQKRARNTNRVPHKGRSARG